ncbi:uncharacterized protein [Ptychodera flava]|uniref:uncharacterized protein isoform X1 n=1 Tax=Ptychodera flava TaxID=63121 RepID=UPI00396A96DB
MATFRRKAVLVALIFCVVFTDLKSASPVERQVDSGQLDWNIRSESIRFWQGNQCVFPPPSLYSQTLVDKLRVCNLPYNPLNIISDVCIAFFTASKPLCQTSIPSVEQRMEETENKPVGELCDDIRSMMLTDEWKGLFHYSTINILSDPLNQSCEKLCGLGQPLHGVCSALDFSVNARSGNVGDTANPVETQTGHVPYDGGLEEPAEEEENVGYTAIQQLGGTGVYAEQPDLAEVGQTVPVENNDQPLLTNTGYDQAEGDADTQLLGENQAGYPQPGQTDAGYGQPGLTETGPGLTDAGYGQTETGQVIPGQNIEQPGLTDTGYGETETGQLIPGQNLEQPGLTDTGYGQTDIGQLIPGQNVEQPGLTDTGYGQTETGQLIPGNVEQPDLTDTGYGQTETGQLIPGNVEQPGLTDTGYGQTESGQLIPGQNVEQPDLTDTRYGQTEIGQLVPGNVEQPGLTDAGYGQTETGQLIPGNVEQPGLTDTGYGQTETGQLIPGNVEQPGLTDTGYGQLVPENVEQPGLTDAGYGQTETGQLIPGNVEQPGLTDTGYGQSESGQLIPGNVEQPGLTDTGYGQIETGQLIPENVEQPGLTDTGYGQTETGQLIPGNVEQPGLTDTGYAQTETGQLIPGQNVEQPDLTDTRYGQTEIGQLIPGDNVVPPGQGETGAKPALTWTGNGYEQIPGAYMPPDQQGATGDGYDTNIIGQQVEGDTIQQQLPYGQELPEGDQGQNLEDLFDKGSDSDRPDNILPGFGGPSREPEFTQPFTTGQGSLARGDNDFSEDSIADSEESESDFDSSDSAGNSILDNLNEMEGGKPAFGQPPYVQPAENIPQGDSGGDFHTYISEEPTNHHFLAYSLTAIILVMGAYVLYHNKQKIVAIIIEGRNRGNDRKRASGSEYQKLTQEPSDA